MAQLKGKQIKDQSININEKLNINEDFNLSGQSITNLRAATGATEAVRYDQLTGITSTAITGVTAERGLSASTTNQVVTIGVDLASDNALEITGGKLDLKSSITGDRTFTNNVTINGDLTVLGTATTLNTETLTVEDNIITLNSTVTAGTPTLNAGIEVLRGSATTMEIRWNETNDWWEITNPDGGGTGATYNPILTTASVSAATDTASVLGVNVTKGVGNDADELRLGIDIDSNTLSADTGVLSVKRVANALTFGTGLSASTSTFDGSQAVTVQFDSSTADSYLTGFTNTTLASDNSNVQEVTLKGNNQFQDVTVTGLTDTYVTGGTYDNGTGEITFDRNDNVSFNVNLGSIDLNDTFVTGGSVTNGALTLELNDGTSSGVTGDILQSITTEDELTATTFSNGSQVIGIDHGTGATQMNSSKIVLSSGNTNNFTGTTVEDALEELRTGSNLKAVPYSGDKELTVTATTVNNNFNTGIAISVTPAETGYVKVEVNGHGVSVGNNDTNKDCYFSSDGTAGNVRAFGAIVAGDLLVWNTIIAGYDVDATDEVSLHYDNLQ